ncbi:hypothetical protein DSY1446 [Desulfitobacterium hafniense Y51]|uniref:Uncharacterized protein n=1 Tax=Desulfitobacterium hafniense (strain Y51) TaxID=138119 RepID=Q24XK7_DESHY|nr:hypothetical protein DSY1446 [Desulfitobacterium hafniense Y51]
MVVSARQLSEGYPTSGRLDSAYFCQVLKDKNLISDVLTGADFPFGVPDPVMFTPIEEDQTGFVIRSSSGQLQNLGKTALGKFLLGMLQGIPVFLLAFFHDYPPPSHLLN